MGARRKKPARRGRARGYYTIGQLLKVRDDARRLLERATKAIEKVGCHFMTIEVESERFACVLRPR